MGERIKSALFVDFDNIFIGLRQDDPRAAEEFGRGARKWLRWIENEMPLPGGATVRDVLVRRCYGNPETFAGYRGYFTRAGFSVVDCPPLTRMAKNSADIVMVMDVLDVLGHSTRFDEFIIMSADADFTPLVLRLRMHDRRTVAIVAGNAAAAYTASCDLVVTDDEFVERALRLPPLPVTRVAPRAPTAPAQTQPVPVAADALLDAIAGRVYEEASGSGELAASRLPEIFREFKEFTPTSNWLGFFSLRSLAEAVVARRPELRLTEDEPWRVAVDVSGTPGTATGAQPAPSANGGNGDLRGHIVDAVREFMRNAEGPVVMARVAQQVVQAVGPRVLETRWAGAGTFRNFLESVDDLGLEMVSSPQPGYIYDPARHTAPEPSLADTRPPNLEGLSDEMVSFIRRISELTNTPRLSPRQYQVLFEVIAKEAERGPADITYSSRAVRDQVLERGESVSRQYVMFILRGIGFTGYRFRRTGVDEAPALARAFQVNVRNLLRSAQVALTGREQELLDEWLLSGAAAPSPAETATTDQGAAAHPDLAAAGDGDEPAPVPQASEFTPRGEDDAPDGGAGATDPEAYWNAAGESSRGASSATPPEGGDDPLRSWFDSWARERDGHQTLAGLDPPDGSGPAPDAPAPGAATSAADWEPPPDSASPVQPHETLSENEAVSSGYAAGSGGTAEHDPPWAAAAWPAERGEATTDGFSSDQPHATGAADESDGYADEAPRFAGDATSFSWPAPLLGSTSAEAGIGVGAGDPGGEVAPHGLPDGAGSTEAQPQPSSASEHGAGDESSQPREWPRDPWVQWPPFSRDE